MTYILSLMISLSFAAESAPKMKANLFSTQKLARLLNDKTNPYFKDLDSAKKQMSNKDFAYFKEISGHKLLPEGYVAQPLRNAVVIMRNKQIVSGVFIKSTNPLILHTFAGKYLTIDPKNILDSINKGTTKTAGLLQMVLLPEANADVTEATLEKKIAFIATVELKRCTGIFICGVENHYVQEENLPTLRDFLSQRGSKVEIICEPDSKNQFRPVFRSQLTPHIYEEFEFWPGEKRPIIYKRSAKITGFAGLEGAPLRAGSFRWSGNTAENIVAADEDKHPTLLASYAVLAQARFKQAQQELGLPNAVVGATCTTGKADCSLQYEPNDTLPMPKKAEYVEMMNQYNVKKGLNPDRATLDEFEKKLAQDKSASNTLQRERATHFTDDQFNWWQNSMIVEVAQNCCEDSACREKEASSGVGLFKHDQSDSESTK